MKWFILENRTTRTSSTLCHQFASSKFNKILLVTGLILQRILSMKTFPLIFFFVLFCGPRGRLWYYGFTTKIDILYFLIGVVGVLQELRSILKMRNAEVVERTV
jgi:hypothetical protein